MYSVILMLAVTTAPEAPSWGHHSSCHGCWSSQAWSSCYGCCGGWGGASYGCCGGQGYAWNYGNSFSGYSCSGCSGNVTSYRSCHGWQPYQNYYTPFSCYGYGVYGGTSYYYPTPYPAGLPSVGYGSGYPIPADSMPRILKTEEMKKIEPKKTDDMKSDDLPKGDKIMADPTFASKAQVVVHLPADAKLYANNQLTTLSSDERSFSTPTLEQGLDYQYVLKIEYERNGKTIADTQIVKVRAGAASVVHFLDKAKAIAVSSTIKFVAPEGTNLFVNERKVAFSKGVHEYTTPELAKGSEYSYEFRAELTRDGKSHAQTQRVVFKAGEPVTVDFSDLDSILTASK